MKIAVIGLGKLGICTAACFASRKHKVFGIDIDEKHIKQLKERKCSIIEPNLQEILDGSYNTEVIVWDNLTFIHTLTDNYRSAIEQSEIICVIVPTPSKPDGSFSNEYILRVFDDIAPYIKKGHIINIISTVMPKSCDEIFIPYLEENTGMSCSDFSLTYNPEFIALGSVVENFLNPDMVLIGCSDDKAGEKVKQLYRLTVTNYPSYQIMSLLNAEITKLSLNCYITTKISFANELGAICEKIIGADVDDITNAMGFDRRIGHKCLTSGTGFMGPCFSRDVNAFIKFAHKNNYASPEIVSATIDVNDQIYSRIIQNIPIDAKKIAVLGLSYKPESHITEESQAIQLIDCLGNNTTIYVHDPKVKLTNVTTNFRFIKKENIIQTDTPEEAIKKSDTVVIMMNHSEYNNIDWEKWASLGIGKTIIDCWRIVPKEYRKFFNYKGFGIGQSTINKKNIK